MAKDNNKRKINPTKQKNDKQSTYILLGTLALCLTVLVVLGVLLVQKLSAPTLNPNPDEQYIFIPDLEGMPLTDAKALLDGAEIPYEIIPAESKTPNRVLSFEYEGKTEDGKILVEMGSTVKLHANETEQNKIVYLTFDDGPTRDNTLEILDILDSYGARATFFVQGKNANIYPDRMTETVERGHLIGCHSYSHAYDDIYSSTDAFTDEVNQYEAEMRKIFGESFDKMPKVLRFPGGSSSNGRLDRDEAKEYIAEVRSMGYSVYDWSSLTNDADSRYQEDGESDREYFIRSLSASLESAKEKSEPLIVLMHDSKKCHDNLTAIMDFLASEGYYFDTLDNCPEYTFAEK